ncbi:hypothetical protein CORC01_07604 [Colletotrichum orchidophilum]|uniref:Uncharacterized protein n=1 Tax=Colletotrichum orchidophilum TaxID=1209926 RepID=A0A1G4B788_9PEZI|nr:hypothetical protein CORC01_07604 [Colletotrichum orchidophilum]
MCLIRGDGAWLVAQSCQSRLTSRST